MPLRRPLSTSRPAASHGSRRCTASGTRYAVIATDRPTGVPIGMAPNPTTAPMLFDRALLRARQSRALRSGPATFLLDRVAEDLAERLHAVLREFKMAADIGTVGDQVRDAVAGRVGKIARIELPDR